MADSYTRTAEESTSLLTKAQRLYDETIGDAHSSADTIVANAQAEAERIVAEAQTQAQRIISEAQAEENDIQQRIEVFKNLEHDYRTALRKSAEDTIAMIDSQVTTVSATTSTPKFDDTPVTDLTW